MSTTVLFATGLAGGCGAVARFGLDRAIMSRFSGGFPLGTLAVNLSGAFALGLLVGLAPSADLLRLAGTGALGGFTTFSTWMFETRRLLDGDEPGPGSANLALSLVLGLAAVWIGRELGLAL